jgi:hypothetical protein
MEVISSRNCPQIENSFNRCHGANMGEVIAFVSRSERERLRLIKEARAIYESIFPSSDPVSERQGKVPASHTAGDANA